MLNVFGLVSLDSLQPSYVGLYSTTDLDEISRIFVGVDTLGWCDCDDDEWVGVVKIRTLMDIGF